MHPVPPRSSPAVATTRVHPSEADDLHRGGHADGRRAAAADRPAVYTVWKRSSMGFQGTDGFSVYDAAGALAFRVDNYSRRRKLFAGELLLMDGSGAPLLALRPQIEDRSARSMQKSRRMQERILSMRDQWNCYRASEEIGSDKSSRRQHLFSMRLCSLVKTSDDAEVYMVGSASSSDRNGEEVPDFRVQGSFWRRSCKIRNGDGEEVARITRKKAGAALESVTLGNDVFTLTVMPNADCTMIMAFVVIMDRICQRPYKPLMCSSS
ncbi:hypothetical protein ACP70R_021654 [Stipagrostis hirtigluma subsp. patula]